LTSHLTHGQVTASESVALADEAFAGVAFPEQFFVFVAEFIPKGVEGFVVGSMDVVRESVYVSLVSVFDLLHCGVFVLVQHRVYDIIERHELCFIARISQA